MKTGYTIAIRNLKGCWQYRQNGLTAREVKRALARKLGIPQSRLELLSLGKRTVTLDSGLMIGDNLQVQLKKLG